MREHISFDSHKHYTWVEREEVGSGQVVHCRLQHAPAVIRHSLGKKGTAQFFSGRPEVRVRRKAGSPIWIEADVCCRGPRARWGDQAALTCTGVLDAITTP